MENEGFLKEGGWLGERVLLISFSQLKAIGINCFISHRISSKKIRVITIPPLPKKIDWQWETKKFM